MGEKRRISRILEQDRDWHNVKDVLPPKGKSVVIRFMRDDAVYAEDEESILYAEDIKIGKFLRNIDDETKGIWVIDPPFPRYDFSPLSDKDQLREGAYVTHWANPTENDLDGWLNRLKPQLPYSRLGVFVDPEHEPLLYYALSEASRYLANACQGLQGEDLDQVFGCYRTVADMLCCLDQNIQIVNDEWIPIDDFLKGELRLCTPSCPGYIEYGDSNSNKSDVNTIWGKSIPENYRPSASEIYDMICRHYGSPTDRNWIFDTLVAMNHQDMSDAVNREEE